MTPLAANPALFAMKRRREIYQNSAAGTTSNRPPAAQLANPHPFP